MELTLTLELKKDGKPLRRVTQRELNLNWSTLMVRDLLADLGSHGAQVDLYEELELAANELLVRAIKEFQELAESRVEYEIRKIKEEDPTREIPMFPTRQSISQRLAPTRELDIEIEDDPQLSEQEEELLRERALAGALLNEIYYD